jgi:hypothetical protein
MRILFMRSRVSRIHQEDAGAAAGFPGDVARREISPYVPASRRTGGAMNNSTNTVRTAAELEAAAEARDSAKTIVVAYIALFALCTLFLYLAFWIVTPWVTGTPTL